MNNNLKKILIGVAIGVVGMYILGLFLVGDNTTRMGSAGSPNLYSGESTNSSTTVGVGATSVLSRNVNRQWAKICNDGEGIVWLYETATDTGVILNLGLPIASSTAYEHCYTIDPLHAYQGQVYGIADVTTTVTFIEK